MNGAFEDTLHYTSPAHGGWGMVRIGMLVPESVQLFVCPFACGRHGAIGAMRQGFKDRLAYLYVDQNDIVRGYDDLIPGAVEELLDALPRRPRVVLIFLSCLDDLIGTDREALLEVLHGRFPDLRFRICHMNPISLDSKSPPPVTIRRRIYSLLEPSETKETSVNSIGNLEAVAPECELHRVLEGLGAGELRHISRCRTFEEFQRMASSRANLVLAPTGVQAAKDMERALGIPFLLLPVSYRIGEIEAGYRQLRDFLDPSGAEPDLSAERAAALVAVEAALRAVGDRPVIVDASAVTRPFGLARALLEYGFSVRRVVAQKCIPIDRENLDWLEGNRPDVELVQPQHHRAVRFEGRLAEALAIGVDGAYLAGAGHVVDLFADGALFGFHGLRVLMERMRAAAEAETDLERLIESYGLVV